MTFAIVLLALVLLMLAAYRGYSVILFAPLAALLAVLLTDAAAVPNVFTGLFMERMVGFLKLYFPVFLLGAVFGKLIELAGFLPLDRFRCRAPRGAAPRGLLHRRRLRVADLRRRLAVCRRICRLPLRG